MSETVKQKIEGITMDDVYMTVGKWVVWGAIVRIALKAVSR
jgi:hypothetical protein